MIIILLLPFIFGNGTEQIEENDEPKVKGGISG